MAPTFRHVALTDIDLDDTQWLLTYHPQRETLRRSLAQVGVVTPVQLRRIPGQDTLQVVCGFQRLYVCGEVGHTEVPALVYDMVELPDEQAFLLMVHENLGCRQLNVVEKARVLWRLQHEFHYQPSTLLQRFCPLLDVPPRHATLTLYGAVVALDEALQIALVDGRLAIQTAVGIGQHAASDREALLRLYTELKLGGNRAREFMTYLDDVCHRDDCRVTSILEGIDLEGILGDDGLSGPQKIARIRDRLRHMRYPQLSRYEERFRAAVRQLHLPGQISFHPPPYFEGIHYEVRFNVGNREELRRYAQELLEAASAETVMTELFGLL